MSHLMTALAMQQTGLKPASKIVLYWLADHHNSETGACFPSLSTLAKECEMDKATVVRHLSKLEDDGLILRRNRTRDNGSRTSSEYELLLKQPVAKHDRACSKMQQSPVANCAAHNLGNNNLGTEPVCVQGDLLGGSNQDSPDAIPKTVRLPTDWTPNDTDMEYALSKQIHPDDIKEMADDFQTYWSELSGAKGRKSYKGWAQCWRNHVTRNAATFIRNRRMAQQAGPIGYGQGGGIAGAVARRQYGG